MPERRLATAMPSTPTNATDPTRARTVASAAFRGIGVVTLVFAVAVGFTLAVAEAQAWRSPPLDLKWAASLTAEARKGGTAAAATLGQLDALARRAYFSHAAFRQTGLLLLIAGLAVTVSALGAARWLVVAPPDPRSYRASPQAGRARGLQSRALIVALGIALVAAVALRGRSPRPVSPLATRDARERDPPDAVVADAPSPPSTNAPSAEPSTTPSASPSRAPSLSAWPSFRGPRGDGVATTQPPSVAALAKATPRWQTPLARAGFSSPVVGGTLVFLTSGDAASREVSAYDLETGALRWTTAIPFGAEAGTALPKVTDDTGFAAPSPAADSEHVYAVFATGDLAALGHDGAIRWQHSLDVPENTYGHASSLLLHDGTVFVQFDNAHGGRALAFRGSDGKTLWDIERDVQTSWASPVLLPTPAGMLLLLNAPDEVAAHHVATGAEAWCVEGVTGEVAPSPAVADGRLFLAQEYSRLVAFDLSAYPPSKLWEQHDELPDISSPVAGHGLVWVATSAGVVSAHDAVSGDLRWRHEFPDGFNASPVLAGDQLFLLDLKGNLHVLGTGAVLAELATVTLGDDAFATPAFLDGRLVVRTRTKLHCFP